MNLARNVSSGTVHRPDCHSQGSRVVHWAYADTLTLDDLRSLPYWLHLCRTCLPGVCSCAQMRAAVTTVLSAAICDALNEWNAAVDASIAEERWPLVRLTGRQRISRYVRRAIFQRDGGRCMACGKQVTLDTAHLDHIVPWSALGADDSTNLRILCVNCNIDRSNFRGLLDTWAARRPPIAFCCADCAHLSRYGLEISDPVPLTDDMQAAFCAFCGLVSRTWPTEIW